ncbi:MAG: hypothetical protein Q8O67_27165 [Deltaproteobacteria bacterium]|nr:hypothetical protein [Deltaproteobacteria bacterium]
MIIVVICHSCQKQHSFSDIVTFRAECDACSSDLHVCLNCKFYDRYVENQCREDQADPVANKDRRNLCEYFKPLGVDAGDDEATKAKAKLAALFGGTQGGTPTSSPAVSSSAADPAAEAKRKLEELFRKK